MGATEKQEGSKASRLALLASGLAAPWLVRAAALTTTRTAAAPTDVAGAVSDLASGLVVVALLLACRAISRWLVFAVATLWALTNYGSFEHIAQLGSALQLTFADFLSDPAFLLGSALAPSRPGLLLLLLLVSVGCALAVGVPPPPRFGWRCAAAGVAMGLALSAWPADNATLAWRTRHFVHENVEFYLSSAPEPGVGADEEVERVFSADLDGEPRVALPSRGANVLLLVLEGLPAVTVRAIGAPGPGGSPLEMQRLSALAEEHIVAANFVLQQRQTNRGLFALLCGDYPKLGHTLARATEYVKRPGHACLPQVLAESGYRTVYMQGAPLSFMYKKAFTLRAGFAHVRGDSLVRDAIARSNWGVDDRSLLRDTRKIVGALRVEGDPWFVTVLTVGSHGPVTLPEGHPRHGEEGFAAALQYLDAAVHELLTGLAADGALADTLVILTSDESRGFEAGSDLAKSISQSWGPLVVLLPERDRRGPDGASVVPMRIEEPYAQSDLALSVLDYLGLEVAGTPFVGRSLFRRYRHPRRVYFSNVFLRRTGAVDGEGGLLWCDEPAVACDRYRTRRRALFVPESEPVPVSPSARSAIRAVVDRSLESEIAGRRVLDIPLAGSKTVQLEEGESQLIMGGQNLHIPENSVLDVRISFRIEGRRGQVQLYHLVTAREGEVLVASDLPRLRVGDRLEVRYTYRTVEAIPSLKARLHVVESKGEELSVAFESSLMRIRHLDEEGARLGSGFSTPMRAEVTSREQTAGNADPEPVGDGPG